MTKDKKWGSNLFRTDVRRLIRFWVTKLFKGPYLPKNLVIFFILEGLTFVAVAIMSQPYGFWSDESIGAQTLRATPFEFLAGCLLAIALAALAFSVVNYRVALFGWIITCIVCLTSIGLWIQGCGISRWFPLPLNSCSGGVYFTNLAGGILIASLLVTNSWLLRPKTEIAESAPTPLQKSLFLLPTGWVLLLIAGMVWAGWQPTSGWLPIKIKSNTFPSPRSDAGIAYDTKRGRAVLFGGSTAWLGDDYEYSRETWEWDGQAWTRMSPKTIPPARKDFGMAYDEQRGVVVMFGGLTNNGAVLADTWEWDGKDWSRVCPCTSPQARAWPEMVYDPERGRVVLYGGTDNQGKFFTDGWEWDGKACTWREIKFDNETPPASAFGLVYDQLHGYKLGFLSGFPGGTWIWQKDSWKQLYPATEPSNRSGSGMAYDPQSKLIFLFGGWVNTSKVNDTWSFDGKDWKPFKSILLPPAMSGSAMFYDPLRKHIVLFGGYAKNEFHNEMWELVLPEQ